ncbi:MAG: glycosyltransferase family 2 protein [Candidatus Omnitrophica bacterium]|nr:glycosyltransferase family 2 protein [Candidatus Omnitrophota bacterium]
METRSLPSLTVVMPCLNEEKNLEQAVRATLSAFGRSRIDGEIIVVNDGSRDRTFEIAESLSRLDKRVRVLNHAEPQGIGASFWGGVQASHMDYVTMIPGDNENAPEEVFTYYYLANDLDIIVPFVQNIEVRSRMRRVISSCYRFIVNFSFGTNLNYTNGAVIYNSRVLKDIKLYSKGFFYQTELLIRLIRLGYLYAEVPYFLKPRHEGKTKALSFKSFYVVMRGYLKLMWDVHVLRKIGQSNLLLHPQSATYRRTQALGHS